MTIHQGLRKLSRAFPRSECSINSNNTWHSSGHRLHYYTASVVNGPESLATITTHVTVEGAIATIIESHRKYLENSNELPSL